MRIEVSDPRAVAEQALWLAWQGCGGTTGMGFLKDRPNATKGEVVASVPARGNKLLADYVFGRMMKLRLDWDDAAVIVPDSDPDVDYQGWARRYLTYEDLVLDAATLPV